MGAQLNIKDADTIRLARELSSQLGMSVTAIVREALEEKAQRRASDRQAKIDAVNAIVADFQRTLPEEWRGKTSKEIMDALYDEDGAPVR